MHVTRYDEIEPFVTVDGSIIDCAAIPPGTVHKLWATGEQPLVLVCSCSPPYSDADTVLVEDGPSAA